MAKKKEDIIEKVYGRKGIDIIVKRLSEEENDIQRDLLLGFITLMTKEIVEKDRDSLTVEEVIKEAEDKIKSYGDDTVQAFSAIVAGFWSY